MLNILRKKIILSLFDYSGNWCWPYVKHGYQVIRIDLKLGTDIFDFMYKHVDRIYGILSAPPCTDFALSGARYFKEKDQNGRTKYSIAVVERILKIVECHKPKFWIVENPMSRIRKLIPALGKIQLKFHPYEFAGWLKDTTKDLYTKTTCLYGKFLLPNKRPIEPDPQRKPFNNWIASDPEMAKTLRSITPMGFSWAFFYENR